MRVSFLQLMIAGVAALGIGLMSAQSAEPTAEGLWEQVDENTGKAESWFRITEKSGIYQGIIVKIFPKPGEDPHAKWLCTKCEGEERNAPVVGLALIKGMRRQGLSYDSGTIMDPRDGTVYRALMNLSPDGRKLEVRGFLGISLFGRSQIWNRLPDNAMDPPASAARSKRPARAKR
jgi:uncharacterized protein (DUF2147 family)